MRIGRIISRTFTAGSAFFCVCFLAMWVYSFIDWMYLDTVNGVYLVDSGIGRLEFRLQHYSNWETPLGNKQDGWPSGWRFYGSRIVRDIWHPAYRPWNWNNLRFRLDYRREAYGPADQGILRSEREP